MVKNLPANTGDLGSIPASGRSPGEGNGYPLQHSCLEKSMDRGAWRASVHGITKSQTLSDLDLTSLPRRYLTLQLLPFATRGHLQASEAKTT